MIFNFPQCFAPQNPFFFWRGSIDRCFASRRWRTPTGLGLFVGQGSRERAHVGVLRRLWFAFMVSMLNTWSASCLYVVPGVSYAHVHSCFSHPHEECRSVRPAREAENSRSARKFSCVWVSRQCTTVVMVMVLVFMLPCFAPDVYVDYVIRRMCVMCRSLIRNKWRAYCRGLRG